MRRGLRRLLQALAGLLLIALLAFFLVVPARVERDMNRVAPAPIPVSARARALHERLRIVDLHGDPLLWGRNLLVRSDRGHIDLPRLLEANVTLQVFSVVTKSPRGLNYVQNEADRPDNVTLLALAQRWPPRTWRSLKQRALYQAGRLEGFAQDSGGRLVMVRTARDLDALLQRRQQDRNVVGALLAMEGSHPIEGDVASVDAFEQAGYRMAAPTHLFDNDLGGDAHGVKKGGLTPLGRAWVKRMEERRLTVDLAHASPAAVADALALATRPVVVSHTGVRGTCDRARNLSDDEVRGVARTGGVIGIGFWDEAVCGVDPRAIARAVRYTVNLVGADHVGLGSDFDGAVTTPFDVTGLPQLTEALLGEGLSEEQVAQVMGGNALRVLRGNLP